MENKSVSDNINYSFTQNISGYHVPVVVAAEANGINTNVTSSGTK
jgi:hypothetical protein